MKHFFLILLICSIGMFSNDIKAQSAPTNYPLIELFTNTPCGICRASNPAFFDLLMNYSEDLHQISFYPGAPYSSCPIYQGNTSQNITRRQYRNIIGTPRVFIDGGNEQSSSQVSAQELEAAISESASAYINVEESLGMSRTVTLDMASFGTPSIDGVLFVAAVEADVLIPNAPSNWEAQHYNVFREFVYGGDMGEAITLTETEQTISFSYDVNPDWDEDQVYILAWIEDPNTKGIFNSGTRFDDKFSSVERIDQSTIDVAFSPNPTTDEIRINDELVNKIAWLGIHNTQGRMVQEVPQLSESRISLNRLQAGSYLLSVRLKSGQEFTWSFIKL